jgi:VIT1/CCC1 family predicted Fe2+/Mn2+ transporter
MERHTRALLFCAGYTLLKRYICGMPAAQKRSLFIINFITGLSDGLILPWAASFIALSLFKDESWKVSGIGIAVSMAGALAFGLARFYGEKEEIRHHHPQLAAPEAEKEAALMQAIDIDPELSRNMLAQMEEEKELWLKEIRENHIGWENYDPRRAAGSGLQTALGFLAGGLLVCLAFSLLVIRMHSPWLALLVGPGICFSLGWYRGRLSGYSPLRNGLLQLMAAMVVIGVALVVVAFIKYQESGGLAGLMFDPAL